MTEPLGKGSKVTYRDPNLYNWEGEIVAIEPVENSKTGIIYIVKWKNAMNQEKPELPSNLRPLEQDEITEDD